MTPAGTLLPTTTSHYLPPHWTLPTTTLQTTCHHTGHCLPLLDCNFVFSVSCTPIYRRQGGNKTNIVEPSPLFKETFLSPRRLIITHPLLKAGFWLSWFPCFSVSLTCSHCLSSSFTEMLFTYLKVHPLRSILSMFLKLCNHHYSSF